MSRLLQYPQHVPTTTEMVASRDLIYYFFELYSIKRVNGTTISKYIVVKNLFFCCLKLNIIFFDHIAVYLIALFYSEEAPIKCAQNGAF